MVSKFIVREKEPGNTGRGMEEKEFPYHTLWKGERILGKTKIN